MALTNATIASTTTTVLFSSSGNNAITTIIFCNTGGADGTLSVYAVASGNVIGTSTTILSSLSLPSLETFTLDTEKLVLANGDVIYAQATVNTIGATVSSVGL
jgi:WD40 repeat protein